MGDIVTDKAKFLRGWRGGLPETPCGSGSKLANTTEQRAFISNIIQRYKFRTVADIGAGDLNWMRKLLTCDVKSAAPGNRSLCGAGYYAFDLISRHPLVMPFDIVNQVPLQYDLIMCLWVLNHLPANQAAKAYENLKASGTTWWLFTDRPAWYHDWPPCLRDLEHVERIVLNRKGDAVLLCKLA